MRLIHILGYAGLLPFIGLTSLQLWPQLLAFSLPFTAFQSYSQIILAFMAGVLWPVFYRQSGLTLPVWVVSIALVGWFSSLLLPQHQLLVLAAAYIAVRLIELRQGSLLNYSPAYHRLRNQLTTVVVICHLLYWWSI
ncbi:Protein of unknown function (DUF3429) [Rheinheimera sp. A13L]|uniref:DUF3429 domain-containing protein n=1 Tax=Rheinheimera sp. A13L TaxID=506534 RepID=UPI000212533F|nr:DUF3429 domain-containing protein [Rheinheimera sp. A13L]EGM77433.1 Protein of unknown function (DUF3429) [Rheinheimera sp. A13L]